MTNYFRVIIAGSRNFNDYILLCNVCDFMLQNKADVLIISGTAKGADKLGEKYAFERGFKLQLFPADWSLGKAAGYIRNEQMVQNADALIAFWDGKSKGTNHMINLAKQYNLKTKIHIY